MATVYLHPVGLDHHIWDHVAPAGAITLDLPGYGDTPAVAELSFAVLVDYVVSQLDGPATLVGLSLGSFLAQHVAVRRPDMVQSLVLAGGGVATTPTLTERAAEIRSQGMRAVLDATLGRWFTADALATPGHPGVAFARRQVLADSAEVFAQYYETVATHDLTKEITAVAVPTTVVAGDSDEAFPVARMRPLAEFIPGAQLVVLEGPHILPLENPQGFARVVEDHLKRANAAAL